MYIDYETMKSNIILKVVRGGKGIRRMGQGKGREGREWGRKRMERGKKGGGVGKEKGDGKTGHREIRGGREVMG
jgi:hypothetical protein